MSQDDRKWVELRTSKSHPKIIKYCKQIVNKDNTKFGECGYQEGRKEAVTRRRLGERKVISVTRPLINNQIFRKVCKYTEVSRNHYKEVEHFRGDPNTTRSK